MRAPPPELLSWTSALTRPGRTVLLGMNGPQGAGKSTLAAWLVEALGTQGIRAFALSIDDLYLTHAEQRALASAHPDDRTLAQRGYPGTHDVALGTAVLSALKAGQGVLVPSYDKSAHAGRGDRAPRERWRRTEPGLDLVIVEGWMLGFRPVAEPPPELARPNRLLAAYAAWDALLDAMILLEAPDLDCVVTWRVDAEAARRAAGQGALSEPEARDYIERFLPAYRTWAPGLLAHPPGRQALRVRLGPDRGVLSVQALAPAGPAR